MRKTHSIIAAAILATGAPGASAEPGAVDVLLRAADMAGAEVAAIEIAGTRAVVDLSWDPASGLPAPADDLTAMLLGALDPSLGVDSILVRVEWKGGIVPVDELWAPPPEVFEALRLEGSENLASWRSSPPPPRHYPATGSCLGRRIFVSPGHGYTWFDTYWATQRGYVNGIQEDASNGETMNEYLIPMLERMGATVMSCRERGRTDVEIVVDNDGGGDGTYEETGEAWRDGAEPGYGGTYRTCEALPAGGSEAVFAFSMPEGDVFPVYVRWVAGTNRGEAVPVRIVHSGGEIVIPVNQTAEDDRWTYLGGWYFEAGETYEIAFSNAGPAGTYVVADAVRVGGGMGDAGPGGEPSGHARWEEAAKYWIQNVGAPASVYDSHAPDELTSDHYSRPGYAEWEGGDAFIMHHTNAFDGTARGTVSFIHETSPSPGSADLADAVHTAIIDDIRAIFEPDWFDRGVRAGNYIEIGNVDSMPAMLLELAFHDNAEDASYLTDPDFRFHVSRAMARGFGEYFSPGLPAPPLPPARVRAVNLGGGTVRIAWEPGADAALPGTPVDRYRIYHSTNGRGFDTGDLATPDTWIDIEGLDWPANHYFLVTSENDGGESMPSETIAVRSSWPDTVSPVLLVGGFDRLDRWVREYENTRDFVIQHGEAIASAAGGAFSFDFAMNEAVAAGDVELGSYQAVIWFCGEESSGDESFSEAERSALGGYLATGGGAFVSGSEIGWDLDETGTDATRAWLVDVLRVSYVSDDAETHAAAPASSGIFAGLAALSFDPADGSPYDADFPDIVSGAAGSLVDLEYATGAGAGLEHDSGETRIVFWGFPFETVADAATRAAYMERILSFLVPDTPVPPEVDEEPDPLPDASTDAEPDAGDACSCRTECACSLTY